MKAGNKIALVYTFLTVGVVAVVTVLFYLFTVSSINRIYYSYLGEKAYLTALKNWEKDEVDEESYALIQQRYEESMTVAREIVLNADSLPETLSILSRYLSPSEIADLYEERVIRFRDKEEMGVALYYPDNEGNFIVLILSENQYGGDIKVRIGWLLLGTVLMGSLLIYLIGRQYALRVVDRIDLAYRSEKNFISNASHELNNPLTAIQGECEISLLKERTPTEYQAALKRIATETKRIIQLMKHLLFLSHGEEEILKNSTEQIFLGEFLRQFLDNRISFSPDNFSYVIKANPHLLKIALGNIINNALKYSGEKKVEIRLRGDILEIEDKGIGIPPEELEKIFQPFYRATNTREYNGHGIGLSLSFRILTIYKAKIDIISQLNNGTIVKIDFSDNRFI